MSEVVFFFSMGEELRVARPLRRRDCPFLFCSPFPQVPHLLKALVPLHQLGERLPGARPQDGVVGAGGRVRQGAGRRAAGRPARAAVSGPPGLGWSC